MPLPADPKIVEMGEDVLAIFKSLAGPHPGFRPAHAKGILVKGTFVPTERAAVLSRAQHFQQASTPVIARFSSSTGLPDLPDSSTNGNPRGLALRFMLAETPRRVHTDIVAHSVPFFPAATPAETLAFFHAVAAASSGADPSALDAHIAAHPAAQAFVAAPKPTPAAFAHEAFYAVNAVRLVDTAGASTYARYRILPVAGLRPLTAEAAAEQPPDFLYDSVRAQLQGSSSTPIRFTLAAQLARPGDVTDDNTIHWPEDGADAREVVELGTVTLDALMADDAAQQKTLIFDPVPRVDGVEPSADPLLDLRAAIYLMSGKERRAA